jgi:hypothetical protein
MLHAVLCYAPVGAAQAAKVAPKDPDLRKKLSECERAVKRIRFEEALSTPVSFLEERVLGTPAMSPPLDSRIHCLLLPRLPPSHTYTPAVDAHPLTIPVVAVAGF